MKHFIKATVLIICFAISFGAIIIYLSLHGYNDRGHYEITEIQRSSAGQVAMIAKRYSRSLDNLAYFVVIGDHVLSSSELKHIYHTDDVIFSTGTDCLTLRWHSPDKLVVTCSGPYLSQERVNLEKRHRGRIVISYENISPDTILTYHIN